jgi:hypothetical protein
VSNSTAKDRLNGFETLGQKTPVRGLKLLMAGMLSLVALRYLF